MIDYQCTPEKTLALSLSVTALESLILLFLEMTLIHTLPPHKVCLYKEWIWQKRENHFYFSCSLYNMLLFGVIYFSHRKGKKRISFLWYIGFQWILFLYNIEYIYFSNYILILNYIFSDSILQVIIINFAVYFCFGLTRVSVLFENRLYFRVHEVLASPTHRVNQAFVRQVEFSCRWNSNLGLFFGTQLKESPIPALAREWDLGWGE